MIGWIIGAVIVIVAGAFVLRSILSSSPERSPSDAIESIAHVDILPSVIKEELIKTEDTVYRKADEVMRMASRETGTVAKKEPEPRKNPLEETSVMKAISDKVEKVKKLSGA